MKEGGRQIKKWLTVSTFRSVTPQSRFTSTDNDPWNDDPSSKSLFDEDNP